MISTYETVAGGRWEIGVESFEDFLCTRFYPAPTAVSAPMALSRNKSCDLSARNESMFHVVCSRYFSAQNRVVYDMAWFTST